MQNAHKNLLQTKNIEKKFVKNSPKLSFPCSPEGPGNSPCNPKNDPGKVGVLECSIEPFMPSNGISPASEAAVSLLFESSPVLCACREAKSECFC